MKSKRTPAREALAEAISDQQQLKALLDEANEARINAISRYYRAKEALEAHERAGRDVKVNSAHLIAALARGGDDDVVVLVRDDDREHHELRKAVAKWSAAKDQIGASIEDIQSNLDRAEFRVTVRARAVVTAPENIERLREGLAELSAEVARRRQGLAYIAGHLDPREREKIHLELNGAADEMTGRSLSYWSWSAALDALKTDADAPLPTENK
jgi:hypothetical protein